MSRMKKQVLLPLWNAALPSGEARVKESFDGGEAVEYALYEGGGAELLHRYLGGGGLYRVPFELRCRAFCALPCEEDDCLDGMHDRVSALFDLFPLTEEGGGVFCGEMGTRPHREKSGENGKCEFSCSFCLYVPRFADKRRSGTPYLIEEGALVPIEGLLSWKKKETGLRTEGQYKDDGFLHGRRGNGLDDVEFSFERCYSAEGQNRLLALSDRSLYGRGRSAVIGTLFEQDGTAVCRVCPAAVLIGEMDLSGAAPVFSGQMLGTGERALYALEETANGLRLGGRIE